MAIRGGREDTDFYEGPTADRIVPLCGTEKSLLLRNIKRTSWKELRDQEHFVRTRASI